MCDEALLDEMANEISYLKKLNAEMLAALKMARAALTDMGSVKALGKVRAAIAKAEGE